MFRIGEFSRMGRVSIKALRHYDELGLLRPALVDRQTGYRYYSIDQLTLLNRIVAYKALGFSLEQSRALIRDGLSTDEMRSLLAARRAELAAAIEEQSRQLVEIDARIGEIERQGRQARYEVMVRHVDARPVVSLRRTVGSYDAVDGLLAEILDGVRDACAVDGYGAVWHRCLHAGPTIECEAFVIIKKQAPPRSLGDVRYLPASPMVCVASDQLDDGRSIYHAATERAEAMGYEVCGPMHEIYYRGSGSAYAVTETQFPIRRATAEDLAAQHN
jgi:DNA-binding transcriptional MerR regulator